MIRLFSAAIRSSVLVSVLICYFFFVPGSGYAQDISFDKQLGAEASKEAEREFGIYHQKELEETVTDIGNKLVSQLSSNPFVYRFSILDTEIPNAFALPGGYVYVTRGLLVLIQNEDELAGILGHEIIHVSERHSVKQMKKGILPSLLMIPGNVIGAMAGQGLGEVINAPIAGTSELLLAGYSRKHETEADNLGMQLTAKAGYNPMALADILQRLSKQLELMNGEMEKKSFLSTHPYTPSRVSNIQSKSVGLTSGKTFVSDEKKFLPKLEGLYYGPNPEQGIFRDSILLHVPLSFAWITPSGWTTAKMPEAAGAISKKEDAMVVMSALPNDSSYESYANVIRKRIMAAGSLKIVSDIDTVINKIPARQLKITEPDNRHSLFIELLFLGYHGNNFQLAGLGSLPDQQTIHNSLTSFREITADEAASVKLQTISVQSANKGETLQAFSKRTNNLFNPKVTSLVNALPENATLKEGELIKTLKEQPLVK